MRYSKRFTEGIGYFVCFLLVIFLIYSYMTTEFGEINEETGELLSIFDLKHGFREYLILFGMFLVSSVVCSLTDRCPYVGIILSAVPLYYTFKLFADKMLVSTPVLYLAFSAFFFAGEIVATAMWLAERPERIRQRRERGIPTFAERMSSLRGRLDRLLGFDQVAGYDKKREKRNKNKKK